MRLPMEYNFQPVHKILSMKCYQKTFRQQNYYSNTEIENAEKRTIILHCFRFLGEFPWHEGNLHPFLKEFDTYLAISPWKDYKKEKADCGLILKAEKVIFRFLPHDIFGYVFYLMHNFYFIRTDKMSRSKQINKMM